jgi:hypothetical protein
MASLGELFIELGVVGDVKPLEKALSTMKKATKEMELQYNAAKRLAKYLDDIKKAQTEKEKADIKKRFEIAVRKDNEFKLAQKIEKQKEFANGIAGVAKGIGIFVGAVTAAAVAVNKFTNDLASSNQEMLNLARTTDTALSTFQKWNGIGKMLGVENAAQQLESLNERLFELQLTGEGARGFQLAGINPLGQDAEGVLEQLRGRVAGLSDTAATYLLKQMGLDPRMLHLLRMSRSEFEALGETARKYQLNDDQRSEIQALNVQLQITAQKLQYLKDRAVLAIMPAWIRFMESFSGVTEILKDFGEKISKFVVKWRGLVVGFVAGLSRLESIKKLFVSISGVVGGLITKIPILGGVFTALGGVFARTLLPLTALYLLLDDLAVYMQGGNSVIGEVTKWAKENGGEISKAFGKMFGGDFLGGVSDLGQKLIDILQDILLTLTRIVDILLGTKIEKASKENIDFIRNLLQIQNEDEFKKLMQEKAPEWTKNVQRFQDSLFMPGINTMVIPPVRNTSDNRVSYTYDQRQINMTNSIQTNQPAYNIENELLFARNAMGSAFA